MKQYHALLILLTCTVLAILPSGCASSSANLAAQAKITRQQAEGIALAEMPSGKITEGELEKEHGKLVWSFDISIPGSKNISEIQVDAVTGEVVSREIETPEQQAKEASEKAKEQRK